MTPEQVELVQSSWAKVAPIADTAADIFYGRLFEVAPDVRALFPDDMAGQKKALMAMLGTAVAGLKNLETIVPAVQACGVRHNAYNVKDEQYDVVGAALLYTLGQGLGDDFTPATQDAWTEVYTTLATVMKDAAAQAA